MGGNSKRNTSNVRHIVRHHSATAGGDVFAFERHWRSLGWNTGGYHEVILPNGDVQLCYNDNVVTNGVLGHNNIAYHICLVGNGSFTPAQERSFEIRARAAMGRFNLQVANVVGHGELTPTACPGTDMNVIRRRVADTSTNNTPPTTNPTPPPPTNSSGGQSLDQLAREVINGRWGNNPERARRLTAAGHNADQVQRRVNEILSGQVSTPPKQSPPPVVQTSNIEVLAREVIQGRWGNNPQRAERLRTAGHDPIAVQNRVNQILRG